MFNVSTITGFNLINFVFSNFVNRGFNFLTSLILAICLVDLKYNSFYQEQKKKVSFVRSHMCPTELFPD